MLYYNRSQERVQEKKGESEVLQLNSSIIARRLVELRGNESREAVAAAVGVSISAISMYENGERIPRDDVKIRFAKYYKKTVQEIFFD